MDIKFKTQSAIIISDIHNTNGDMMLSKKGINSGSDKKVAPSQCYDVCSIQWSQYYEYFKQWNDKKRVLDESYRYMSQVVSSMPLPKESSDTIANILKEETSIVVVQSLIKLMCIFKSTVIPNFVGWKKVTIQLLSKFKEKKLEDDVTKCLLSLHETIKLGELLLIIRTLVIGDKLSSINPNAKRFIPAWIGKHLMMHPRCLKVTDAYQFGEMLISLTNDSHSDVREEALNTLGIMKAIPEYKLDSLIGIINPPKKKILLKAAEDYLRSISATNPASPESSAMKLVSAKPSVDISLISEYDVAVEKLKTTIDNEIIDGLNSADIANKIEALNRLRDIMKNIIDSEVGTLKECQESYICLIAKTARVEKEETLELTRASLNALSMITNNINISQVSLKCLLPFMIEKGAQLSFMGQIEEMIICMCDNTGPSNITTFLLEYITGVSIESYYIVAYSLLCKMIEEYSLKLFPAQAIIQYCQSHISNNCRKPWIIKLLKAMYNETGPHIIFCFHNQPDDIIKELSKELSSIPLGSPSKTAKPIKFTSYSDAEQSISIIDYVIPKTTISIPSEILVELDNTMHSFAKIKLLILNSFARVSILNLHELIKWLGNVNKSADFKIVLESVNIILFLCRAVGKDLTAHNSIIVALLSNSLINSIKVVKDAAYQAFVEYANITGYEVIVHYFANSLLKGNSSLRLEALKWLVNEYNKCTNCENELLIPGVLSSLQDPSLEIRLMAEELLSCITKHIKIASFNIAIEKCKADSKAMLQQVINKCYNRISVLSSNSSFDKKEEPKESGVFKSKMELEINVSLILQSHIKSDAYDMLLKAKLSSSMQAPQFNFEKSNIPMGEMNQSLLSSPLIKSIKVSSKSNQQIEGRITNITVQKVSQKMLKYSGKNGGVRPKSKQSKAKSQLSYSFDSQSAVNSSRIAAIKYAYTKELAKGYSFQIVCHPKNKEERLEYEKCIWPMSENKVAYMEVLKKQLQPIINGRIFDQMFNTTDFTKHVDCINTMASNLKTEYNELISILDLILKWLAFGNIDINTGVQKSEVEFFELLYEQLKMNSYSFLECEIQSLVPVLIRLVNSSNYYIKNKSKEILLQTTQYTSPIKITAYLIKVLKSTNTKLKIECMEILYTLTINIGTKIIQDKDLNILANSICTKEIMLKTDINKIIIEILNKEGNTGWIRMGKLSDEAVKEINEKVTEANKVQNCLKKTEKVISNVKPQITKCRNGISQRNNSLDMANKKSFCFDKIQHDATTFNLRAKKPNENKTVVNMHHHDEINYATNGSENQNKIISALKSNNTSMDDIKVDSSKYNKSGLTASLFIEQSLKLQRNKEANKSLMEGHNVIDKEHDSRRESITKSTFDIDNAVDIIAIATHLIANTNTNIYQTTTKVIRILQTEHPLPQLESLLEAYSRYQPLQQITDVQLLTDLVIQILLYIEDNGKSSKSIADSLDNILNRTNDELITIALIKVLIETKGKFRIILSKGFSKLAKRIRITIIPSVLLEINKFIILKSIDDSDMPIMKPFITECIKALDSNGIQQIEKFPFCETIQLCLEEAILLQFNGFGEIVKNIKYMSRDKIISEIRNFAEKNAGFDMNKALRVYSKQMALCSVVEKEGTPNKVPTIEKAIEKNKVNKYLNTDTAEGNISLRYLKLTEEINRLKTNGIL